MTSGKICNVGLCAYGMSGRVFHAPFLQAHDAFVLKSVVERNANESIKQYPDIKVCRSVAELVADKELDIIFINTPVQLHYEHTMAVLSGGKNAVVEKPFCVTSEEAKTLIHLANQNNCLLSVYQNRRWDRDFCQVKGIVHQEILGDIHEVEMRFDRFRSIASGKLHKEGPLPGAGALYDIGAHLVDQALVLFGKPEAIFADVRTIKDDVIADDYFEILLYYPSQLRVRLISSTMAKEPTAGYVLHGNKGSFIQKRSDTQESLLASGIDPLSPEYQPSLEEPDGLLHIISDGVSRRELLHSAPTSYHGYYDALKRALRQEASNPVTAHEGLLTIYILETALQSSKAKAIISLN